MMLSLLALWIGMSAQAQAPQIKIGEIRSMHKRCQMWEGRGWITLNAEMGVLWCEEKDGQLHVTGSPDDIDATAWSNEGNGGGDIPTHFLAQEFARAAQWAADETDGKPPVVPTPPEGRTYCAYDGPKQRWECADPKGKITYPDWEKPPNAEPVDVPAVQEQETYKTGDQSCKQAAECEGKGMSCNVVICKDETATRPITTCSDKSHILLHDESNPPKFWCHKVQP